MLLRILLKSKRIMKNTAPNHNTIHTVLFSEPQASLTVRDIPVNGQQGIGRHLITKLFNLRNQLPVGIYFAHFCSGAQMNGQIHNVLLQNMG
ncbi:hypothetical protein D3C81_1715790 [compost metagenome]